VRLDVYLVEKELVDSRNKAQSLIKNKQVFVDDKAITKSSFVVDDSMSVEVRAEIIYVSRAGMKLKEFFDEVEVDTVDKVCLDIGSSTGGFSQVLLMNSVKSIDCVDVGSEQLHQSIKSNPKVSVYENCDIRDFKSDKDYDILTCDVSFISISHILDAINNLAKDNIIILFKPQFEVGKEIKRDKNGVVKDNNAIELSLAKFHEKVSTYGWRLQEQKESKVKGKDGNREFFFYYKK
jgi:23S rRNA (cytidine1920-2'-O)/16S rRNA (cytidine1409-2'-O)-methyltransferase